MALKMKKGLVQAPTQTGEYVPLPALVGGNVLELDLQREGIEVEFPTMEDLQELKSQSGGADWNAKENEPGFIKNKPFDDDAVVYVSEQTLQFTFDDDPDILNKAVKLVNYEENPEFIEALKIVRKYELYTDGSAYDQATEEQRNILMAAYMPEGNSVMKIKYNDQIFDFYFGRWSPILTLIVGASKQQNGARIALYNLAFWKKDMAEYEPENMSMDDITQEDLLYYIPIASHDKGIAKAKEFFATNSFTISAISTIAKKPINQNVISPYLTAIFNYDQDGYTCGVAEGGVDGTNQATGYGSHAEGILTIALGNDAHAEGYHTTASGYDSHAEGSYTIASGGYQHVQGRSNIEDTTSAHIVGNGTYTTRSNAHTLDWSGNAWFAGDVYVGSTSKKNKDAGSLKLVTTKELQAAVANISGGSTTIDEDALTETVMNNIITPQVKAAKFINALISTQAAPAYINLGTLGKNVNTLKFVISGYVQNAGTDMCCLLGAQYSVNSARYQIYATNSGWTYYNGGNKDTCKTIAADVSNVNTQITLMPTKFTVEPGSLQSDALASTSRVYAYPHYLFASDIQGISITGTSGKRAIKYVKIYSNDELIAEYKAAVDSEGVYCMYETVSKTFVYSANEYKFSGEV